MGKLEMLDCVGVPEYFVTHIGAIEDAGGGMVRIVRCIERHGVLIPVFSSITPAMKILQISPMCIEFAQKTMRGEMASH